jgi:hypothetical protein
MKKVFFLIAITMLAVNLDAQQKPRPKAVQPYVQAKPGLPQARLGIFAGPNFNYLDYYDKVTTIEGTSTDFHAGLFLEKSITKYFAVQPALLFSIRGGKVRDIDSTTNASLMNIELPINFLYLYKQLLFGAGPNFCYGLSGKLKSNGMKRDAYDASESHERTLKRFEFGGNFMVGYTFKKGVFITANFLPGFTNIYKGDGSAPIDIKAKTRSFGISVGYSFETAKK